MTVSILAFVCPDNYRERCREVLKYKTATGDLGLGGGVLSWVGFYSRQMIG